MIKSKRLFAAGIAAALVLAACGGDDDDSGDGGDDGQRVGLAFDTGGRGDGTFNDAAGRGADRAETELGVSVVELEAATADDRQPNLETLTDDGIPVIVANGFAFGDGVAAVAAANPDTHYAITDGFIPDAPANVTHLGFAEHEGSFLVGAAASLACGSCATLGFIGGQEIDLIKKFEAGYTAGAEYINPDVTVNVQYLGAAGDNAAWGSPDKAKEIANSWYADGVEVIYSAAGGSGQGTIEAATESDKWAIGVDSDSYLTASEEQQPHILTSMLKRVDVAVFDVYQQFLGDTLAASSEASGGFFTYDLKADGVGYSESGGFLADYVDQLEEIKAEIIAGTITVPDSVG